MRPARNGTPVVSPLVRRLAGVVSFLGHPLVTTLAFVGVLAKGQLAGAAAIWAIGSVLLVVGTISLWNYRRTRIGAYSNFDVSQREQRNSFYPVLLVSMGMVTAGLFWQQQAGLFRYGMLAAWLLLLLCYGLNFWLKVSLHAALSFFLAVIVLHLYHGWWGLVMMAVALLVAVSRLVLGRHSVRELAVGAAVGVTAAGGLITFFLF